jgi:hypothetical protein
LIRAIRLGVVLTQFNDDSRKFVVVYASQSNNKMEAKNSSYEGKCIAIDAPPNSLRNPNVGPKANNEKRR